MSLIAELQRRNVIRAGIAYAVAAWLLIQVAETIFPLFGFDRTPARIVVIVLAIGFIPAMVLAWAFEWTPEGFRRDTEAGARSAVADKRIDRWIMAGLAVAVGYFAFDKFVLEPRREEVEQKLQAEQLAQATEEARVAGRTDALIDAYGDQSIAVLPFADMSPEGDQEYFSDGIAEEVLNLLAQVPELRVVSRSSSFSFKGKALEVTEIAKRLKVNHVLEGSVRKTGNTVRITAQLIDAKSDTHLWSDTWDRELIGVFAIQDEIAALVAEELQLALLGDPRASASVDMQAYDAVLRGRYLLHQYSEDPDVVRRARSLFEEAIAIAPDYAPAHAWLAKAFLRRVPGEDDWETRRTLVEASATKALELDPNESVALAVLGDVNFWGSDQPDGEMARRLWLKAIESNPSNSDAYWSLSNSYSQTDSVLYLEHSRRAHHVDPTYWATAKNLAYALTRFARYEEAIAVAREYHDLVPDSIQPFDWVVDFHMRAGHLVDVVRLSYWLYRAEPDEIHYGWLPWAMLELEEYDLAAAWSLELEQGNANWNRMNGPHVRALAANAQGRPDEGMRLLIEAADDTGYGSYRINVGFARMHWDRDFRGARQEFEQVLGPLDGPVRLGEDRAPNWMLMVGHALVLLHTDDEAIASDLLAQLSARLMRHLDTGVTLVQDASIYAVAAGLNAITGDKDRAFEYLRQAVSSEVLVRSGLIKISPQFDSLRGDPEFEALVAELAATRAEQRRQLAEAGLLLTPEEVKALDEYEYDPFSVDTD